MTEYAIYFDDLKEETQKELLEFLEVKDPKELNLDINYLTLIPKPEKEE